MPTGTGMPLPRFVSLRTDKANMRTGPGTRYPIEWVFKREGLPLEITTEYDVWRRVRDWEGAQGWIHQSTLSGHRTLVVTGESPHKIRKNKGINAPPRATVFPGAIGKIISCDIAWCKVRFDNIIGYLPKSAFWGTYPAEKIK